MHSSRSLFLALLATVAGGNAWADDDIWTRKTLLDSPGGPKQELAAKGVDLGLDPHRFHAGAAERRHGLGQRRQVRPALQPRWPEARHLARLLRHRAWEYNYGSNVNQDAPGLNIIPINTALAYPSLNDSMISLLFTQAFSPTTALTFGLFNMFDAASRRPLVGGGGIDTFWNLAVAAPLTNITPPYIYGISLNTRNDIGSFGLFIYDPRDAQNLNIIRDLFSEGATYSATATFPVTIGGLGGFQNLRVAYSTLDGSDLSFAAARASASRRQFKDDRWYFQYSFEQFLVQDPKDPKVGWGLFGQFGYSDGNPNAFQGHGYIGLAGNNMMDGPPARPLGHRLLLVPAERRVPERAARGRLDASSRRRARKSSTTGRSRRGSA